MTRCRASFGDLLGLGPACLGGDADRLFPSGYGLTMRGLMTHHGVDPDAFNEHVHDVDLSEIEPNPALGEAIDGAAGRKVIHTNSDQGHTARVLARLGMTGLFDAAYDIKFTAYEPKPKPEPFDAVMLRRAGNRTARRCLRIPHAICWSRTTLA